MATVERAQEVLARLFDVRGARPIVTGELKGAVPLLASPAGSFVTGTALVVDGGAITY